VWLEAVYLFFPVCLRSLLTHISIHTCPLAGTEDGLLARCSTSYAEQYLEVLQAHSAPINRLRLSPFSPHAMLTCSADWSVKLWNLSSGLTAAAGSSASALTFQTDAVQDAVSDISWSPIVATVFASVTRDGHIQVWELGSLSPLVDWISTLDADVWKSHMEAQAAERAAAAAIEAAEARRKRRQELGYDDDDDPDDMPEGAGGAGAAGDADDMTKAQNSVDATLMPPTDEDASPRVEAPPPRKRLTCVIFADTNTQVLVTGDTTGRVDVYRIVGLDDVMDTTVAASSSGGGVDALQNEDGAGGGGGATSPDGKGKGASGQRGVGSGLAVGSEAYEAQFTALQAVLTSMVTSN
jgi:hypothetical protein